MDRAGNTTGLQMYVYASKRCQMLVSALAVSLCLYMSRDKVPNAWQLFPGKQKRNARRSHKQQLIFTEIEIRQAAKTFSYWLPGLAELGDIGFSTKGTHSINWRTVRAKRFRKEGLLYCHIEPPERASLQSTWICLWSSNCTLAVTCPSQLHKILQDPVVLDLRLALRFVRYVCKQLRRNTTKRKKRRGGNIKGKIVFGDHYRCWQRLSALLRTCNIEPCGCAVLFQALVIKTVLMLLWYSILSGQGANTPKQGRTGNWALRSVNTKVALKKNIKCVLVEQKFT